MDIASSLQSYVTINSIALLALGLATIGYFTMSLWGRNHMPVDGKTILITGGSEGLGLSVAKKLAAKGASIVIVARDTTKLDSALVEIQAAAKRPAEQRFLCLSADVAVPSYAKAIVQQTIAWNSGRPIDIVWCIAGFSTPMLYAEDDDAVHVSRKAMDVNYFGSAEMAHAILQEWWSLDKSTTPAAAAPKHLIFTASVLAFYAIVGYSTYSPSKWALRGLADTLAQEALLYPAQPVKIHVVYPGTILTAAFERENMRKPGVTKQLEKDDPQLTPDQVAERAIKGLERGDHFVTVGLLGQAMRWGVMGGSMRNNWFVDILGAWLMAPIWFIVLQVMHGDIRTWAKKYGHPSMNSKIATQ